MGLIKTTAQQARLREAGKLLAAVFDLVSSLIKAGVTPALLDKKAHELILDLGGTASFYNYEGYPNAACISVNDQVIHAIPSQIPLKEGDIVTVDIGLWHRQVCVDAARTFAVGEITPEAKRLIRATAESLDRGVAEIIPGQRIGAISHAVEQVARKNKLGIVRSYTGHGVGTKVHEEPNIPNYGKTTDGPVMKPGMVLAVEPMFTLGGGEVKTLIDGWTVVTCDHSLAAQFEHTILVTDTGHEVLV